MLASAYVMSPSAAKALRSICSRAACRGRGKWAVGATSLQTITSELFQCRDFRRDKRHRRGERAVSEPGQQALGGGRQCQYLGLPGCPWAVRPS